MKWITFPSFMNSKQAFSSFDITYEILFNIHEKNTFILENSEATSCCKCNLVNKIQVSFIVNIFILFFVESTSQILLIFCNNDYIKYGLHLIITSSPIISESSVVDSLIRFFLLSRNINFPRIFCT